MQPTLKDSLQLLLKEQANPVLVEYSGDSEKVFSASALWSLALEQRRILRKNGVKKHDIVIDRTKGIERLIHFLACMIHGCVFVPLPERVKNTELFTETTEESTLKVFQYGASIELCGDLSPKYEFLHCFRDNVQSNSIVLGFCSSGTSSKETEVYFFTDQAILEQIQSHIEFFPQDEQTKACILPGFHAFGFVLDQLLGLFLKHCIIMMDGQPLNLRFLSKKIEELELSLLALVPRQIDFLIRQIQSSNDTQAFSKITIHTGGAILSDSLKRLAERYFLRVIEGYGLTECGPGVLMDGVAVSCSKVKLSELQYHAQTFRSLWVKTNSLAVNPSVRKLAVDGFLPTFDVGEKNPDGAIRVTGRVSNHVKTQSGEWITLQKTSELLQKRFGLELAALRPTASHLEVRVLGKNSQELAQSIKEYTKKLFGTNTVVYCYQGDDNVLDMLKLSKSKSSYDAFLNIESKHFEAV